VEVLEQDILELFKRVTIIIGLKSLVTSLEFSANTLLESKCSKADKHIKISNAQVNLVKHHQSTAPLRQCGSCRV
jgi:hypothetical protein